MKSSNADDTCEATNDSLKNALKALLKLIAVPAGVSLMMLITYLLAPEEYLKIYGMMAAYVFPLGHFAILSAPGLGLTLPQAVAALTFMDAMVCLMILLNFNLLVKIPFIGPRIGAAKEKAREWLEKWKWLGALEFVGIVLFVAVPVPGTGIIVGTLAARLLGMSWLMSFASVALGGLIVCLTLALPAYGIARIF